MFIWFGFLRRRKTVVSAVFCLLESLKEEMAGPQSQSISLGHDHAFYKYDRCNTILTSVLIVLKVMINLKVKMIKECLLSIPSLIILIPRDTSTRGHCAVRMTLRVTVPIVAR
jgi:hypothetical protein